MHRNRINKIIIALSIIGAFATWSRWCWLPETLGSAPKALGLHFFEGWLVFLLLGFVAGLQWVGIRQKGSMNPVSAVLSGLALLICLVFIYKFEAKHACNALWISLFNAAAVMILSVILWIRDSSIKLQTEPN